MENRNNMFMLISYQLPRHYTNYELVPTQEYYERDLWKTIEEVIKENITPITYVQILPRQHNKYELCE